MFLNFKWPMVIYMYEIFHIKPPALIFSMVGLSNTVVTSEPSSKWIITSS
jgi:hypothetical protein